MLTVGIETSGQFGSVAVVDDGRVLASASLSHTGRRHARTLVSELKALFEQINRSPRDAECVAVCIGPGSFTGLRVGVVCAKTLAYAIGCRLVAVDSLEAIATACLTDMTSVVTLVDAMRGDAFHALYNRIALPPIEDPQTGRDASQSLRSTLANESALIRWQRQGDIGLAPWRDLIPTIPATVPLSGPLLASLSTEELNHATAPPACWHPDAVQVARIGELEAAAGRNDDLWRLEPLYIRKSAAEEKLDSAAVAMPTS
ncbi:MAG: tRNA (adenosine(37)-N6)-threonylcarbamoyltransferase complex dimerization subunit type 1 TsaB [Planctomycetaceae bacterium]